MAGSYVPLVTRTEAPRLSLGDRSPSARRGAPNDLNMAACRNFTDSDDRNRTLSSIVPCVWVSMSVKLSLRGAA
jgi:hypothetical protein